MSATLTVILAELREDHRNLSILLDMVESEMLRIDGGEDPDLDLLLDIMRYMTTYSDAVHHPKEDLVYAEMRAAGDATAEGLDGIVTDHADIANLGRALRDDVEAMIAGNAVRRDTVLRDAIDYVRRLRNHMAWEEEDLFLRADALAEKHVDTIELGALAMRDPVFGDARRDAYRNLLRNLQVASHA